MRILWCEEHAQAEDGEGLCHRGRLDGFGFDGFTDCRMVPMRLIPDNALAGIDREALAEALKFNRVDDTEYEFIVRDAARVVLAALDGETP